MLDDPANATKSDIVGKTEDLCREMQEIFAEWQLVSHVRYLSIRLLIAH